jgi:cyclase
MIATRIIPRLDIKGPNLVKGIHLEGLRVLGDPAEFAKFYYENGADELIYQDVVASLYERNSLHDIISKTAKQVFIPITVGGGLRTIDDIKNVLRAGADKVSLNTAAIKNPNLIKEASKKFGSSTIIVAIEAIKQNNGIYLAYIDNGREETGIEVKQWAQCVEELGAGEINITSVDREGTGQGFDCDLIKLISDAVSIPVIAHGGPGKLDHTADAIIKGNAHAVSLASVLHYDFVQNKLFEQKNEEGNTEFLKSGKTNSKISPCSLTQVKEYYKSIGIKVR